MPTETAKPRLIDANALLEEMKDLMDNDNEDDEWNKPLKFALKLINSAPTVETTDDVLARFEEKEISFQSMDDGLYFMNQLQLSLTRLLGKKDLSFGCRIVNKESGNENGITEAFKFSYSDVDVVRLISGGIISEEECYRDFEIIGHEPTIADLLKGLNNSIKYHLWHLTCDGFEIEYQENWEWKKKYVDYDFSKSLLSQSEETLNEIISLIQSYERN